MITLHTLKTTKEDAKKRKRVGRGGAHGTFCGRGCKGQKARSGYSRRLGFEGGRTPLVQKLPKFKGNKSLQEKATLISFKDINKNFKDGDEVNAVSLKKLDLISKKSSNWKIVLEKGKINHKIKVSAKHTTSSVAKLITEAGGEIIKEVEPQEESQNKKEASNK
ncbi:50S ribosomal protein L15 [Patescibacteria group bacterium]|nr:50S ribosomal protein L15 [Patescibacteria group bacterium]